MSERTATRVVETEAGRLARAERRDAAAEQRDERATERDRRARAVSQDLDQGFSERFLSATDRDEAAGDRAEARADRAAARRELDASSAALAAALEEAGTGVDYQVALADRTVIGIAQGLLMARYRLTATGAFQLLSRKSMLDNRRIRDLARDLLLEHSARSGHGPPADAT